MSLATRCTACGTIFRVVEDQLRVSEGWVRCGRCAEVFDARELLFDIDREAPPPWPPQNFTANDDHHGAPMDAPVEPAISRAQAQTFEPAAEDAPWDEPRAHSHAANPAAQSRFHDQQEHDLGERHGTRAQRPQEAPNSQLGSAQDSRLDSHFDARQEPQWLDEPKESPRPTPPAADKLNARIEPPAMDMGDGPDVLLSPSLQQASEQQPPAAAESKEQPQKKTKKQDASANAANTTNSAASEPNAVPEFLRSSHGAQSRWHSAAMRAGLSLAALLLASVFVLQVGLHYRDAIAAQQTYLRPALKALCELKGCELKPWHNIEAISVETSALNQAGAGNHYKLQVGLRNKSRAEVAMPWVELSLTDASGQLLAKRSLRPSDLHAERMAIAPGSEANLQTLLSTGPTKVSGYSVEIFYP